MSEGKTLDFDPTIKKTQTISEIARQVLDRGLGIPKEKMPDRVELEPEAHMHLGEMRKQTAANGREFFSPLCTKTSDLNSGIEWNAPVYPAHNGSVSFELQNKGFEWAKSNNKKVVGTVHTHPSSFKENFIKLMSRFLPTKRVLGNPLEFSMNDIRNTRSLASEAPLAIVLDKDYNYLLIPTEFTRASMYVERNIPPYEPGKELPQDSQLRQQLDDIGKRIHEAYKRNDYTTLVNLSALDLHLRYGFEVYKGKAGQPLEKMVFAKTSS